MLFYKADISDQCYQGKCFGFFLFFTVTGDEFELIQYMAHISLWPLSKGNCILMMLILFCFFFFVLYEISYSQWTKQIGKFCIRIKQLNISYPTICYEALKWYWKPKVITSPFWMFCLEKKRGKWICCYRTNSKLKLITFKTQHYLLVRNSKYLWVMVLFGNWRRNWTGMPYLAWLETTQLQSK